MQHALALAQRTRQRVAVMFLDLDNFKNVNDSLGHDAGDRLLQACAQRLVKSTRPSDTVARLGGDESAILLEGISEEADVERVAATITRSFDEPLQLDGSDNVLPVRGDAVRAGDTVLGAITSVAVHHEEGPIALALVKRTAPEGVPLVVDTADGPLAAAAETVVPADAGATAAVPRLPRLGRRRAAE